MKVHHKLELEPPKLFIQSLDDKTQERIRMKRKKINSKKKTRRKINKLQLMLCKQKRVLKGGKILN